MLSSQIVETSNSCISFQYLFFKFMNLFTLSRYSQMAQLHL